MAITSHATLSVVEERVWRPGQHLSPSCEVCATTEGAQRIARISAHRMCMHLGPPKPGFRTTTVKSDGSAPAFRTAASRYPVCCSAARLPQLALANAHSCADSMRPGLALVSRRIVSATTLSATSELPMPVTGRPNHRLSLAACAPGRRISRRGATTWA